MSEFLKVNFDMDKIKGLGKDGAAAIRVGIGNVLADIEARSVPEVPVRSSNLVNSVSSFLAPGGLKGILRASAKDSSGHDYASDVHYGTRAHVILPKNKKALFWPGGRHPVKKVQHPGTKGTPFFHIGIRKTNIQGSFDSGVNNFLTKRGW